MTIQDAQSEKLISVGVKGLEPVIVAYINGSQITFLPKITITVETKNRGIHMSRLIESAMLGWLSTIQKRPPRIENLGVEILNYIKRRKNLIGCNIDNIYIKLEGRYIYDVMEPCDAIIETTKKDNKIVNMVGVRVTCISACPCVLEESKGKYTHMQNVEITAMRQDGSIVEMIETIEKLITPTRTLLKRDEEVKIVERAYKDPLFVEDAVRRLSEHFDYVYVESNESIHKHKAIASWRKTS